MGGFVPTCQTAPVVREPAALATKRLRSVDKLRGYRRSNGVGDTGAHGGTSPLQGTAPARAAEGRTLYQE